MTGLALNSLLTRGAAPGALSDLAKAWRTDQITASLPGMAGFAASPSLGNKLRGALGSALLQSASSAVRARRPCDWPMTSTAEIFFGSRPLIRLGDHSSEIAKPFVLEAVGAEDGSLSVRARIFGLARERTHSFADSLIASLRRSVNWQDMAKDGPRFLPKRIEPEDVRIILGDRINTDENAPGAADLVFLTPVDADRGAPEFSPSLILERVVRRVALVAPWCGMSLAGAYDDLLACARAVVIDEFDLTSIPSPEIGGHHLANMLSPPPVISLSGPLDGLWPALRICEAAHIGRGASLGLGRFKIATR